VGGYEKQQTQGKKRKKEAPITLLYHFLRMSPLELPGTHFRLWRPLTQLRGQGQQGQQGGSRGGRGKKKKKGKERGEG